MDGYDGCRAMTILNATELYIHKASVMVCVFSHNKNGFKDYFLKWKNTYLTLKALGHNTIFSWTQFTCKYIKRIYINDIKDNI